MKKRLTLFIEEKMECLDLKLDNAKLQYADCCLRQKSNFVIKKKEESCHIYEAQIRVLRDILSELNTMIV